MPLGDIVNTFPTKHTADKENINPAVLARAQKISSKPEETMDDLPRQEERQQHTGPSSDPLSEVLRQLLESISDLTKKVGNLDEKVGNLDEKVGNLDEKVGNLDKKVGNLDEKVGKFMEEQNTHNEKVDKFMEEQKTHNEKVDEFMEEQKTHNEKVDEFMEEQKTHNEKVDEFMEEQKTRNEKVDEFMEEQKTHNEKVDEKLDSILEGSPQVLVRRCLRHVHIVGGKSRLRSTLAMRKGAVSTWTFILGPQKQCLAVSAAHCIDVHSEVEGNDQIAFMQVPRELADLVVGVGLRRDHVFGKEDTLIPVSKDMSFLLLSKFPHGIMAEELPQWGVTTHATIKELHGAAVGGKSPSCYVYGDQCVGDGDGKSYEFNCHSGEPGNSGTLMHRLCSEGKGSAFGIFLGLNYPNEVKRGIICPFADFERFQVLDLVISDTAEFNVKHNPRENVKTERYSLAMAGLQGSQRFFVSQPDNSSSICGVLVRRP